MQQLQRQQVFSGTGNHAYSVFGAHPIDLNQNHGFTFSVYAPHAKQVQLIGSFNEWRGTPMQRDADGVWTRVEQDAREWDLYKYRITDQQDNQIDKADPFAFMSECRDQHASIIYSIENFPWNDTSWMQNRDKNYHRPMSVYEMHVGSWKWKDPNGTDLDRFYNYEELAQQLIPYIKYMGYTHVELLPLTEHPYDGSWGYQSSGYYSMTGRFGNPRKLMQFVNLLHQNQIGVIFDFVPVHFVSDSYSLGMFDGTPLFESEQCSRQKTPWGTEYFDVSKPFVQSFLTSSLHFMAEYFHVDGIRYDAVSYFIHPNGNAENGIDTQGVEFLQHANAQMQKNHPAVMLIAEDSSQQVKVTAPVEYDGLGFDYKWDLGWMHDTLNYLSQPAEQRKKDPSGLLASMQYFYQDLYLLPLSHDEVVHGKKAIIEKIPGSYEEKFSQLKAFYLYMMAHPGKKLNFMTNDLAEFMEWDEAKPLAWSILNFPMHRFFHFFYAQLWKTYRANPSFYQDDYHPNRFQWIDRAEQYPAVFTFCRGEKETPIYLVVNFSGDAVANYTIPIGMPRYRILLHTEWCTFGGEVPLTLQALHANKNQIVCDLPPFGAIAFEGISCVDEKAVQKI